MPANCRNRFEVARQPQLREPGLSLLQPAVGIVANSLRRLSCNVCDVNENSDKRRRCTTPASITARTVGKFHAVEQHDPCDDGGGSE
jgi:hypothetical protein